MHSTDIPHLSIQQIHQDKSTVSKSTVSKSTGHNVVDLGQWHQGFCHTIPGYWEECENVVIQIFSIHVLKTDYRMLCGSPFM